MHVIIYFVKRAYFINPGINKKKKEKEEAFVGVV